MASCSNCVEFIHLGLSFVTDKMNFYKHWMYSMEQGKTQE